MAQVKHMGLKSNRKVTRVDATKLVDSWTAEHPEVRLVLEIAERAKLAESFTPAMMVDIAHEFVANPTISQLPAL